jgi:pimeloyl-ACP methyl ester carboxylesterase
MPARAVYLLALFLASCSTGINPRTQVARERLGENERENLRDREMAQALEDAALAADRGRIGVEKYNDAVLRLVLALQKRAAPHDWTEPIQVARPGQDWLISFQGHQELAPGLREWTPVWFDRVIPARECQAKDCSNPVSGAGTGAPVVLAREDVDELVKERTFRPRTGIYVPATVLVEFGRAPNEEAPLPVRLKLINTFDHRRAMLAGAERALAYDVTASLQMALENRYVTKNALAGLIRPDKRDDAGLFAITPYDPQKIPVVFVHGLKSDAHIWRNAINEIFNDPVLSAKYQPVCFLYPSGLSVPASSGKLRASLRAYRDMWDPEHDDPGMNRMVVVGHSMGGILSRMQVMDSGDDMRKAFFTRPVEEVPWLTDGQVERLKKALEFEHQPFVKRAVFIAVPHRGSKVADLRIVQLAIRLIRLPGEALSLAKQLLTEDTSVLNPALLNYHLIGLRSVDMLSPGHPYFKAMEKRPIKVPYHSIIGDRGRGDTPDSSDGVVPYWSSHLAGAQSELIVPYGHGCVEKPETVQEVLRLLRLHAGLKH